MRLALRWSLDPTRLNATSANPGLGYIAVAPAAWRPERLKSAARVQRQLPAPQPDVNSAPRRAQNSK
jgi:hypothetical protein